MNDYIYIQILNDRALWEKTHLHVHGIYKAKAEIVGSTSHCRVLSSVEVLVLFPHIDAIPELEKGKRPPMYWVGSDGHHT